MTKAEEKISSFRKFGWKLGLERMRSLCGLLGDPQEELNVIHVAGTNGKGSVCRYLYEVLLAHGYTVGLFTSPGLGDFRSRIEANGAWITEADLESCTDRVMAAVSGMSGGDGNGGGGGSSGGDGSSDSDGSSGGDGNGSIDGNGEPPTEFEVLTAVALFYFASKGLDFVVLEVGLGGVADSTNIVSSPLVSVITEIGLDHTEYLGDTTEKIAAEKAGIIKPGRPVVTSATGKAAGVIAKRAYELGAPLVYAHAETAGAFIGAPSQAETAGAVAGAPAQAETAGAVADAPAHAETAGAVADAPAHAETAGAAAGVHAAGGIRTRIVSEGLEGTVFSCVIRGSRYDNIFLSMPGKHQVDNAVCALATIDVLRHMKCGRSAARAMTPSPLHGADKPSERAVWTRAGSDTGPGSDTGINSGIGSDTDTGALDRLLPLRSSSDALRAGMKAARLPGRFQIVCRSPLVIFDGAHNQAGAAALRKAAASLLKGRRILVLIAMMRDKRTGDILKEIREFADGVMFTETSNERGMDAASLAEVWSRIDAGAGVATEAVIPCPGEAYDLACSKTRSGRYDALVICGSLYLISDLLSATGSAPDL